MLKTPSLRAIIFLLCLLALFLATPFFVGPYGLKFATRLLILATFVVSLDFLLGLAGLVSFGHAAFFGVGAYAVYFVSPDSAAANGFVALAAGFFGAGLVALFIGAFACLTRGFYFIMVTLAAGQMLYSLFHDTDIAKGSDGAYINVKPEIVFGQWTLVDFDNRRAFFYLCIFVLLATLAILSWLARAPFGRAIQGLRANETRLAALGFNVYRFKLAAFVVSGAFAGLAGALFACVDGIVTPDLFSWHQSGLAIMMVVLGGAGTLFGPVLGAFAYISLEDLLKTASLVGPAIADHWRLGTGATLVIAVLMAPDGLFGFLNGHKASIQKTPAPLAPDNFADDAPRKAREMSTDNLSKHFGGLRAVDGVTIRFGANQVHVIIGPNGAGKTSFINLLSGALKPSGGAVYVDADDVTGWPAYKIAQRGVARSFQRTNIFLSFTAEENCQLAAQAAHPSVFRLTDKGYGANERAHTRHALIVSGLAESADRIAAELSNGEQRQLEIAMLVASGGGVLILDEPLAGMGPEETRRVVDLLLDLKSNHTIILIEHDMDAVFAVADTLTVLAQGKLLAHGTPDEVRQDEAVIAAYLGGSAPPKKTGDSHKKSEGQS